MKKNGTLSNKQERIERILFEIPDFDEFGEILHDRLHAILYHVEELTEKFMLITNLFDRDTQRIKALREKGETDIEKLIYAGTLRQRQILERDDPEYYIKESTDWEAKWKNERDQNWLALKGRLLTRDMEKVETFLFFDDFRQGRLDEGSIEIGTLRDYFANLDNILQINEYPIVSDYFDIQKDLYIGIPLLGTVLFQGIVWIIFPKKFAFKFEDKATVRRIMKLFKMEYDNLVMSWDIRGRNITRSSIFGETKYPTNIFIADTSHSWVCFLTLNFKYPKKNILLLWKP